jgi:hypothetical protein
VSAYFILRPLSSRWKSPPYARDMRLVGSKTGLATAQKTDLRLSQRWLRRTLIFWGVTPCSPLKFNRRCKGTCLRLQGQDLFPTCFHAGSCLTYFSILKMEATFSSETSVDFQQTKRRYIPEYRNIREVFLSLTGTEPRLFRKQKAVILTEFIYLYFINGLCLEQVT